NEIKEEPVNMKEELIEDFVEVKKEEPIFNIFCPSTGTSRPFEQSDPIIIDLPATEKVHFSICLNCTKFESDMRYFTVNPKKRELWVNAVRSTPEGRGALMAQLNAINRSYLCSSHFSPSDFVHYISGTRLASDAIPFYVVS
ncbi:hypothetical protein PMAYCL1PPCAC_08292, partial [Pristionchus mayeri]